MQTITTFLMFTGNAEEAMNFYMGLFKHSEIKSIERYTAEGPGKEGSIVHATFSLNGQELMCIDSPVAHAFTFTPAMSLYVSCDTEEETERLYKNLSKDGQVLMPLNEYPFSKKYGWVTDKYGVSWQLSFSGK